MVSRYTSITGGSDAHIAHGGRQVAVRGNGARVIDVRALSVAVTDDGVVGVVRHDNTVAVYSPDSESPTFCSLHCRLCQVRGMGFLPNGRLVVVAMHGDMHVYAFDPPTWRLSVRRAVPTADVLDSMRCSPDGAYVVLDDHAARYVVDVLE